MRLKTFSAADMPQALALVKQTMGDGAVILSSREDKVRKTVVVTAGIDDTVIEQLSTQQPTNIINHTTTSESISGIISMLKGHNCPEEIIHQLIYQMQDNDLSTAFARIFQFDAPDIERPLIFIGANGSGKTIATARLAMQVTLSDNNVPVYSSDYSKAGGLQQLANLLKVLQINLNATKSINQTLAKSAFSPCLMDTSGLHPYSKEDAEALTKIPHRYADVALVIPAGLDAEETAELCKAYYDLVPYHYIIFTKLDQSRKLGNILAAAYTVSQMGVKLAYAGQSGSAAKPFLTLNPQSLTASLYSN